MLRIALGIKNTIYWSVIVPGVEPKPLLTPLTGSYRKTPVLQVDADVYCGTEIAIEAIETLPGPRLFPAPLGRAGAMIAAHAGGPMFFPAVGNAVAPVAEKSPTASGPTVQHCSVYRAGWSSRAHRTTSRSFAPGLP